LMEVPLLLSFLTQESDCTLTFTLTHRTLE
jgi:hypothetical protein